MLRGISLWRSIKLCKCLPVDLSGTVQAQPNHFLAWGNMGNPSRKRYIFQDIKLAIVVLLITVVIAKSKQIVLPRVQLTLWLLNESYFPFLVNPFQKNSCS